jgi:hypothetical protein
MTIGASKRYGSLAAAQGTVQALPSQAEAGLVFLHLCTAGRVTRHRP